MSGLDPRTWFKRHGRSLVVEAGRVACPNRGDADVETCLACGHMLALSRGAREAVVCAYRADDTATVFVQRGA
jgi:hypothetical protein